MPTRSEQTADTTGRLLSQNDIVIRPSPWRSHYDGSSMGEFRARRCALSEMTSTHCFIRLARHAGGQVFTID